MVDAAQTHAETIDVAAQHAPQRAALRATGESRHGGGRPAVVAGRGVAGQHDAVERQIGSDVPGMLARTAITLPGVSGDQPSATPRALWRPVPWRNTGRNRLPGRSDEGPGRRCADCRRGRCSSLQFVVEALAHHRPIAQVLGDRPYQLDPPATEFGDLSGRGRQEAFLGLREPLPAAPAGTVRRRSTPAECAPGRIRPAERAAALRRAE